MTKTILMAYQGHTIQFNDAGWFNATTAAARFDKEPHEWTRLPDTAKYIAALEARYGKIPYVKTSRARADRGGGTWMHPKLGVAFARWLDVDFAVWCDEQIETIIHGEPEQNDWRRLRHEAASSYKVMSDVLMESRADVGKDTKPYHYANEAKLVNWAMTGEYAQLDRAGLNSDDLSTLAKLEARNAVLIAKGASRALRRELLQASVEQMHSKRIASES